MNGFAQWVTGHAPWLALVAAFAGSEIRMRLGRRASGARS